MLDISDVLGFLNLTEENIQDLVGGMLTDTSSATMTYDDPAGTIQVDVIPEFVEDTVGTMVVNTTTINFTYDDGAGSLAADVNDDSITLAKIQVAAANSKLVGSGASGSGANYVELTLGTNLSITGTTLNAAGGGASPLTTKGDVFTYDTDDQRLAVGADGEVLTADAAEATGLKWAAAAGGGGDFLETNEVIHVRDEKATGTHGGSSSSGDNIRTLNTVVTNTLSGASLSSNQITLPAGTYLIDAWGIAMRSNQTRAILYNVTDAAVELLGSVEYSGQSDTTALPALVRGQFTITSEKDFELRQYFNNATASIGFGNRSNDGRTEVYSDVYIRKINAAAIVEHSVQTTDATVTDLLTVDVGSGEAVAIEVFGMAIEPGNEKSLAFKVLGSASNTGGTTRLNGFIVDIARDEADSPGVADWDIDVDIDDTADTIRVRVTGEAATTIDWQGNLASITRS
jgi:hypothetical protein